MTQIKIINEFTKIVSKLPGLGPRGAKRIVLHLLDNKENTLLPLMSIMNEVYKDVKHCSICGNLTTDDLCEICSSKTRSRDIICVIETVADLWSIDSSGVYNGLYHVLGGNLSASEGRTPDTLNINKLIKRLENNDIKEVIIATNPTIEGQTTAFFISDLLQKFKIKITKPALGIPIGTEFTYLDDSTVDIAFKNKKEF